IEFSTRFTRSTHLRPASTKARGSDSPSSRDWWMLTGVESPCRPMSRTAPSSRCCFPLPGLEPTWPREAFGPDHEAEAPDGHRRVRQESIHEPRHISKDRSGGQNARLVRGPRGEAVRLYGGKRWQGEALAQLDARPNRAVRREGQCARRLARYE